MHAGEDFVILVCAVLTWYWRDWQTNKRTFDDSYNSACVGYMLCYRLIQQGSNLLELSRIEHSNYGFTAANSPKSGKNSEFCVRLSYIYVGYLE